MNLARFPRRRYTEGETPMDAIVCASGSSGTQAGLVAGTALYNMNIPVIGINVGVTEKGQKVLFVHTGGATALPVYQNYLLARQDPEILS